MRRRRSKLRRLIFALMPALMLWAGLEAGLRIAGYRGPDADWLEFPNNHRRSPGYAIHPKRFWAHRPGFAELETNSLGLRGPEVAIEKPSGVYRVLCLGDSVTFGFDVKDAESFPRRLEAHLNRLMPPAGRPIERFEVINAGVVGYSSLQGLRYLEELLRFKPDLVLVSFGSNDQLCSMTVSDSDQPIINPLIQRAWLGLTSLRSVQLLRQGIGQLVGAQRSSLYREADCEGNPIRVGPEQYRNNLHAIDRLCREAGARAVFLPPLERPGYEGRCMRVIPAYAVPEDLAQINWLEPFAGLCGADADRLFMDGTHFTPRGSEVAARWVGEHLFP